MGQSRLCGAVSRVWDEAWRDVTMENEKATGNSECGTWAQRDGMINDDPGSLCTAAVNINPTMHCSNVQYSRTEYRQHNALY